MKTASPPRRTSWRQRLLAGTRHPYSLFFPRRPGALRSLLLRLFYSGITFDKVQQAKLEALPADAIVVSKATRSEKEAYSDFEDTGLAGQLQAAGIRRLLVMGLATDDCVLATVRDACAAGFEVVVAVDGVRAVDVNPGDGERALARMREDGASLLAG